MAKLNKRVWGNDLLSEKTKMCVYQACVLSTLLYGSESWTTYARQERRLNGFHLRCLRHLLHIRWQDRVTNTAVLERAGALSMPSLLIQRRLRWLGHAHRMEPDHLPREILYGELREGVRHVGRPLLRYKDVIKRDLRSALIDTSAWEDIAKHRDTWRQSVKVGVSKAKANARVQATCKRASRKDRAASARDSTRHSAPPATETATPGSGYTVIQDPAQIPSANHLLFETRMSLLLLQVLDFTVRHYSRSKLTDWTSEGWIQGKVTSKAH